MASKDENLKNIKELLEIIQTKVSTIEFSQRASTSQLKFVRDQQSVINEKLDSHAKTLASHTKTLVSIDKQINSIRTGNKELIDWLGEELGKINLKLDEIIPAQNRSSREIERIKKHVGLSTS